MAETIRYRDLDFSFKSHPVSSDLAVKTDEEAVKQSIKHLVRTQLFENMFLPNLGSNTLSMLFESVDPINALHLQRLIAQTINNYEPRASVVDVTATVNLDQQRYDVTILFYIQNESDYSELNFPLERIR